MDDDAVTIALSEARVLYPKAVFVQTGDEGQHATELTGAQIEHRHARMPNVLLLLFPVRHVQEQKAVRQEQRLSVRRPTGGVKVGMPAEETPCGSIRQRREESAR